MDLVLTLLVALLVVAVAGMGRLAVGASRRAALQSRLEGAAPGVEGEAGVSVRLLDPPEAVVQWLDEAGVDLPAPLAWTAWLSGAFVLTVGAVLFVGPGASGLALLISTAGPLLVLRARRGQGRQRLERGLPLALEAMARSLRSGASLRQAVAEAGSVTPGRLGRELALVGRQVEEGATLVAALEALAGRHPAPGVRLAVTALCLSVETGGGQARAVDGVAATVRDRLAVAAEVRALASQARISAVVIGLAPLAFGAFAIATDPQTGRFLFHTPAGLALLAVGCALDGLGWLWMQRLARVPA
ncbi:MAG: type II secretion system F family protein [Actinobacteria bacterium]|nr:type II secretion system F family protein [Actinomycetota bacterium]